MSDNRQTIKIVRGTTNSFSVQITDGDQPYQLQSGEIIRFGVKSLPTNTAYIFSKTVTQANEDDEYVFTISPTDTASLDFGSYWYDIGLQSGADYFNIIPASPFEVAYNVTKWEA